MPDDNKTKMQQLLNLIDDLHKRLCIVTGDKQFCDMLITKDIVNTMLFKCNQICSGFSHEIIEAYGMKFCKITDENHTFYRLFPVLFEPTDGNIYKLDDVYCARTNNICVTRSSDIDVSDFGVVISDGIATFMLYRNNWRHVSNGKCADKLDVLISASKNNSLFMKFKESNTSTKGN